METERTLPICLEDRSIHVPSCTLFLETCLNFLLSVEDLALSINRAIDGIVCHDIHCVHCTSTRQLPTPNYPEESNCVCLDLLRDKIFFTPDQIKEIDQNITILELFSHTTKVGEYKREIEWLVSERSSNPPSSPTQPSQVIPIRPPSPTIDEIQQNENRAYVLAEIRSIVDYVNKFQLKEYIQQRTALLDLKLFFQRVAFLQTESYNAASFIQKFENFDFLSKYREFCESCCPRCTDIDSIFLLSPPSTEPIVDCRLLYKHRVNLLLYYFIPKPDFSPILS